MSFGPIKPDVEGGIAQLTAERDKYKAHSTTLNEIGWLVSEALGRVTEGVDGVMGNPKADVQKLIAERDALRAGNSRLTQDLHIALEGAKELPAQVRKLTEERDHYVAESENYAKLARDTLRGGGEDHQTLALELAKTKAELAKAQTELAKAHAQIPVNKTVPPDKELAEAVRRGRTRGTEAGRQLVLAAATFSAYVQALNETVAMQARKREQERLKGRQR